MLLDGVLSQAASGLDSVTKRLATVAQNVANANTPGYVRESLPVQSLVAAGDGMGVRSGVTTRTVDTALQGDLFAAGGRVADGQMRQTTLSAIDAAAGTPGSGQDLAGLVGALRDGFSTLSTDPSDQAQQARVVSQAVAVARGVNTLGQAVSDVRQTIQNGLVDDVAAANTALRTIGTLSDQVMLAQARGDSTADLEDKRDTAMRDVATLTGARFLRQANGDVLAFSGGTALPTRAATGPLSIAAATLAPDTPATAVPALLVGGQAAPIAGGRIGAGLDLRDRVLPGLQSGLDGFAQALATGFAGQGLTLFTDAAGAVPAAGTAGFAQGIQVNPAVTATPSMVRDGAAAAGAAGDTTLIDRLLDAVLATGSGTIAGQASDLVARHAALAAAASSTVQTDQAVQSSLQTKLDAGTGVSVDSEMADMVRLQNSYGANAKVVSAVQAMWTQLLDIVR